MPQDFHYRYSLATRVPLGTVCCPSCFLKYLFLTFERYNFKTKVTEPDAGLLMEMLDFLILVVCSSFSKILSFYMIWTTDVLMDFQPINCHVFVGNMSEIKK